MALSRIKWAIKATKVRRATSLEIKDSSLADNRVLRVSKAIKGIKAVSKDSKDSSLATKAVNRGTKVNLDNRADSKDSKVNREARAVPRVDSSLVSKEAKVLKVAKVLRVAPKGKADSLVAKVSKVRVVKVKAVAKAATNLETKARKTARRMVPKAVPKVDSLAVKEASLDNRDSLEAVRTVRATKAVRAVSLEASPMVKEAKAETSLAVSRGERKMDSLEISLDSKAALKADNSLVAKAVAKAVPKMVHRVDSKGACKARKVSPTDRAATSRMVKADSKVAPKAVSLVAKVVRAECSLETSLEVRAVNQAVSLEAKVAHRVACSPMAVRVVPKAARRAVRRVALKAAVSRAVANLVAKTDFRMDSSLAVSRERPTVLPAVRSSEATPPHPIHPTEAEKAIPTAAITQAVEENLRLLRTIQGLSERSKAGKATSPRKMEASPKGRMEAKPPTATATAIPAQTIPMTAMKTVRTANTMRKLPIRLGLSTG